MELAQIKCYKQPRVQRHRLPSMSDISSVPSRANSPVHLSPEQVPTARPYRFTWDPASRRPGPESVSGTTEGRGDDFAASPHPMGFLNHSSANLALGALPTEWSSSRTGFHGISMPYVCCVLHLLKHMQPI